MASHWTCKSCRWKNVRTASGKCGMCGLQTKPKRRVPKHAQTLRDDSYDTYVQVNLSVHGVEDECAVCGKPPSQERRLDRDHDHVHGRPRGLACHLCNRLMPKQLTLERARAVVSYLERVEAHYSQEERRAA